MLSRIKDGKYIILEDYRAYADEYDKKTLDEFLDKLDKANQVMADIYSELIDYPEINSFVREHGIGNSDDYDVFADVCVSIAELKEQLKSDDEIPKPETRLTLQDIGFKNNSYPKNWYERIIEDTEEKEVVEELQIRDKIYYRRRTIFWEKVEYGKASKEIIYEDLPLMEELKRIIKNTIHA